MSFRLGDALSGALERIKAPKTIQLWPMPSGIQGSSDICHAELLISVGRVRDKSDIKGNRHAQTSVGMMLAALPAFWWEEQPR
jgi:hypothetical protein